MAKATDWTSSDAEARKLGEQTGLDTRSQESGVRSQKTAVFSLQASYSWLLKCPPHGKLCGVHLAISGELSVRRDNPDGSRIPRRDIDPLETIRRTPLGVMI